LVLKTLIDKNLRNRIKTIFLVLLSDQKKGRFFRISKTNATKRYSMLRVRLLLKASSVVLDVFPSHFVKLGLQGYQGLQIIHALKSHNAYAIVFE